MAVLLLEKGVKALGRAMIPSLVKQGLGANAIIRELWGSGISYRRTDMLADIREFTGLHKLEKTVTALSWDILFPQYAMVEHKLGMARRYRVFGKMTLENPFTWERQTVDVSFYIQDRMTKEQWKTMIEEAITWEKYRGDFDYSDLTITSVEHNRGWSY